MNHKILKIIDDVIFLKLVERYYSMPKSADNSDNSVEGVLAKFKSDLKTNRYIIPVLGTQGCGKSSFLNAILFDDIILPVDADETTCIPIEVSYTNNPVAEAKAIFKDGSIVDVPCNESSLATYVHQDKNPANKLNVLKIELKVKNPLLENGVILVDLPGVGSITAENQKITFDYIKQAVGAIFILRTVPPITKSESIFIQGAWPLLNKPFFIQNKWTDESDAEVLDGKEYNLDILSKIASDCHLPAHDLNIDTICIKWALDAKVKDDLVLLDKSQIPAFIDKVKLFTADWRIQLVKCRRDLLLNILYACKSKIDNQVSSVSTEKEKVKIQINATRKQFEHELRNKKKLIIECKTYKKEQTKEIYKLLLAKCQRASEELRNAVREVIASGIVDGTQLESAYQDHLNEQNEMIFKEIQPAIIRIFQEVQARLSEIEDFSFEASLLNSTGHFKEQSKVHEFYSPILDTVGGLAGGIYGAQVGIIGGPIGICVGTVAGFFIGGMIASFLGRKAHAYHLASQKEEAMKQLFDHIECFKKETKEAYKNTIDNCFNDIDLKMDSWLLSREEEFHNSIEDIERNINKTEEEKHYLLTELQKDQDILEIFNNQLKEICQP